MPNPHFLSSRRQVTPDEIRLWRETMKGARPIRQSAAVVVSPDEGSGADLIVNPPQPAPAPAPVPKEPLPWLVEGAGVGLDKRTAGRLRKGKMSVEAVLDLHGLTLEPAFRALLSFIDRSLAAGLRTLLVITGKGGREGVGKLRAELPRWLNEERLRSRIVAFSVAQPQHGGGGAYYLLLKRRRS